MCIFLRVREVRGECRVFEFSGRTDGLCLCCLTFEVRRDRRYCALPAQSIMNHRRCAGKVQCRWASPRPKG